MFDDIMKWIAIIVGLIVMLVLVNVTALMIALTGSVIFVAAIFSIIISALIGGMATGFMAKGDLMNGGVHGAVMGASAGILILIHAAIFSSGSSDPIAIMLTRTLSILVFAIFGAIGGLISVFIIEKRSKSL